MGAKEPANHTSRDWVMLNSRATNVDTAETTAPIIMPKTGTKSDDLSLIFLNKKKNIIDPTKENIIADVVLKKRLAEGTKR